jgi:hypothetical protein
VTISVTPVSECTPLRSVTSVKGAVRTADGGRLRVDLTRTKLPLGLGTYWVGTVRYENTANRVNIFANVFTKNAVVQPLTDHCRGARLRFGAFDIGRLPLRTGTLDLRLIDDDAPEPDRVLLQFGRTAVDAQTTSGDITIR